MTIITLAVMDLSLKFQSTLPQGKWRCDDYIFWDFGYFNPHFRKGSDKPRLYVLLITRISIHTSAREVTQLDIFLSQFGYNFNPHFRKGSDDIMHIFFPFLLISIHTSAREVTLLRFIHLYKCYYFNPHFRKGSDAWLAGEDGIYAQFQSTLPQGKWRLTQMPLIY